MVCDVIMAVSPTHGKLGVFFFVFQLFLVPLVMYKLHIAALYFSVLIILVCKNRIDKLVFHLMACELNPGLLTFMNCTL